MWIHSETQTLHDKNIQSSVRFSIFIFFGSYLHSSKSVFTMESSIVIDKDLHGAFFFVHFCFENLCLHYHHIYLFLFLCIYHYHYKQVHYKILFSIIFQLFSILDCSFFNCCITQIFEHSQSFVEASCIMVS